MLVEEAKLEMIKYGKIMYHNGMVNMFEGNISLHFQDRFFITPSQQSKEDMTTDMIVELDEEGNVLNPSDNYKPSSEYRMHLKCYKLRPDINAVVHNHSLYATAYAVAGKSIKSDALTEMNLMFGEIPLAAYGTPGTDAITKDFPKYLSNGNALLLANHGLLTVGYNLQLAYSVAEAVEKIAQMLFLVKHLGGESALPEEELTMLRTAGEMRRKESIAQAIVATGMAKEK